VPRELRAARLAVTLTFFLNGAVFGSWAARLPALQDRLGLQEGALGVALAFSALGSLLAMPVAGWLSARSGSRRTTRLALALFSLAVPLAAAAPAYGPLLVGTFLVGATTGALDVAMNAHGVAVERRYGRAILSSLHAAWSGGGLAGAAVGAAVAGLGVDARAHLAAAGGLALVIGALATRRLLAASEDEAADDGAPLLAWPSRKLLALGVVAFCGLMAEGSAADWSAVYVDDALAAGAGLAGLAYAAFSLAMLGGRLVGDRLADAWGPVALVRRGGLLASVGLGAALVIGEPPAALVGFTCLGAGIAAIVPVVFRGASQAPGIAPGVALAAVSTMGYCGFLVGPPAIGGVAQATSLPLALGLVVLLTVIIVLLAGRTRPASADAAVPARAEARATA
jgi:MFS family permease